MQRGYPGRGGRDGDRRDPAPRTSSYHDRRRDLTPPRGDRAREREASSRRGGPPRGHDISPRRSGAGWGYSGGSRQGGPGAGRVVSSPYRADPGWGVVSRSSGGGRAASPRPRDSGWDLCTLPSREGRQLERERHHRTRSPRSPKRRDSPRQQGMTPSPRRMFERQREDDTRERHSGCKETVPEVHVARHAQGTLVASSSIPPAAADVDAEGLLYSGDSTRTLVSCNTISDSQSHIYYCFTHTQSHRVAQMQFFPQSYTKIPPNSTIFPQSAAQNPLQEYPLSPSSTRFYPSQLIPRS